MFRLSSFSLLILALAKNANRASHLGQYGDLALGMFANTNQKRGKVNVANFIGTYDAFISKKHLSPLVGAIASHTGLVNRLHALSTNAQQPSATDQLIRTLFYRHGEQFKSTQNKTNPAYSLTPTILAEILHHLDAGNLDRTGVRDNIYESINKQHRESTGNKTTVKKLNIIFDAISKSKKECMNNQYPRTLTETILLCFMDCKANSRQDITAYMSRLQELESIIDVNLLLDDSCDSSYIDQGKSLIENLAVEESIDVESEFKHNKERVLLALMLMDMRLKTVVTNRYSYGGGDAKPHCVEAAFQNLCHILLYNRVTGDFNLSLLPTSLKLNEKLVGYFEMLGFKSNRAQDYMAGRQFSKMLSDQSNFEYRSGNYELISTRNNFLPVMNYLFGCEAGTLAELSILFSDNKRNIVFSEEGEDSIAVVIKTANTEEEKTVIKFGNHHAELTSKNLAVNHDVILNTDTTRLSRLAAAQAKHDFLLFSLLENMPLDGRSSSDFIDEQHSIEQLNAMMLNHEPRDANQAYHLFVKLMPYFSTHGHYEKYAIMLAGKFNEMLVIAARNERNDIGVMLLAMGVNANYSNTSGKTALHYASEAEFALALLKAGANPHALSDIDMTPLHYNISPSVIRILLNAKADPNARDIEGRTPLHHARMTDIVIALLDGGANPMAVDNTGLIPLHSSINVEITRALIQAGANVNAVDYRYGKTPLDCADNKDIINELLKAGAKRGIDLSARQSMRY